MIKIVRAEISRLNLPLLKPLAAGFGSLDVRESILVTLYSDKGLSGIGEAPVLTMPIFNAETQGTAIAVIKDAFLPRVLNQTFEGPEQFDDALGIFKGNEFAKSAMVMAFYDLLGIATGRQVRELIGGTKGSLQLSSTVGIYPTVAQAVQQAKEYEERGVEFIKLKTKPGFDTEYIEGIQKACPHSKLMIDANSSYTYSDETVALYKRIDQYKLFCIEQPLRSDDLIDHSKLQAELRTPLALDESVTSVYHAQKAVEIGSCRLLNIKVSRVGGIAAAIKINQFCASKNVTTWVGGMLESPIGLYANLALASVPNFDLPVDFMGGSTYIAGFNDLFESLPYEIDGDQVTLKLQSPGLGFTINWDAFDTRITERISCA